MNEVNYEPNAASLKPPKKRRPLWLVLLLAILGVSVTAPVLYFLVYQVALRAPVAPKNPSDPNAPYQAGERSVPAGIDRISTPRPLVGHQDVVTSIAFSPDGTQLASGSEDQTVRIWDIKTGREIRRLEGHTGPVLCVAYSPDGKRIASGGEGDNNVRIWDAQTGELVEMLEGHREHVKALAFLPTGKLISGGADANAWIWDIESAEPIRPLAGHEERIRCIAASRDGTVGITGAEDGMARLWDLRSGEQLWSWTTPSAMSAISIPGLGQMRGMSTVFAVALAPDGLRAYTLSFNGPVRAWDLKEQRELPDPVKIDEAEKVPGDQEGGQAIHTPFLIHGGMAFSTEGNHLLVETGSYVVVIDLRGGAPNFAAETGGNNDLNKDVYAISSNGQIGAFTSVAGGARHGPQTPPHVIWLFDSETAKAARSSGSSSTK